MPAKAGMHDLPPSPSSLAASEAALKGKALRADAYASPLTAAPPAAGAKKRPGRRNAVNRTKKHFASSWPDLIRPSTPCAQKNAPEIRGRF
jgi:hypothetical protein